MEWGHFNADEVAPFQMKSWSPSERFFVKSDWSIQSLFYRSTSDGDEPRLIMRNWVNSEDQVEERQFFILFRAIFSSVLFFSHFSFLFSHRYQSSSSGCWPQACTEGAWRGHSTVAQPSCDESHNYSGHMDGKCKMSFCILQLTLI